MVSDLYSECLERKYDSRLWTDGVTSPVLRLKPKGDGHGVHDVAQSELARAFLALFDPDRDKVKQRLMKRQLRGSDEGGGVGVNIRAKHGRLQ
ncbi:hypothetical protein F0562_017292 [Nyssa sinensis]|uniref:Uncharacterized protein n=1 Tax=Nyssa sinensis TaxID=561372 RepID=A0A5J4ZEF1_9ASTE|nr:hypothetical protein F0562_017292 [Nyssa sinensis]